MTVRKYLRPMIMLAIFETIAITLWLTKDNVFYLFNFSYIGCSIALGMILFIRKHRHARRIVQLLVGLYMLVYLGLICRENMQIEGFWYYLFTGVFEAATIHYAVAKIPQDARSIRGSTIAQIRSTIRLITPTMIVMKMTVPMTTGTSLLLTALISIEPIPGIAKMFSVTTAPPIVPAKLIPICVTTGIRLFLMA